MGEDAWPDYLAPRLAVCSEINTLKGMLFWNGCLSNQNLNQIIALPKKKKRKKKKQLLRFTPHWELNNYCITTDIRRKGRYNKLNNIFLKRYPSLNPWNLWMLPYVTKRTLQTWLCVFVPSLNGEVVLNYPKESVSHSVSARLCNPMNCS